MAWGPRLNTVCGRCGKPRGVSHTCYSNRKARPTLKLRVGWGKCPDCGKSYGSNPLLHVCAKKSDFRQRKAAHEKRERDRAREAARKAKPPHDYTECSDEECRRSLCVAFKAGRALGDEEGHARGWQQGYDRGLAERPRDHK